MAPIQDSAQQGLSSLLASAWASRLVCQRQEREKTCLACQQLGQSSLGFLPAETERTAPDFHMHVVLRATSIATPTLTGPLSFGRVRDAGNENW